MKKALFSILWTLVLSATAHASGLTGLTGMTLKEKCVYGTKPEAEYAQLDYAHDAWCSGFLYALINTQDGNDIWTGSRVETIAFPDNLTVGQAELVRVKYMNEHPEHLDWEAVRVANVAFAKAWHK
jgi:hypothetical protein